LLADRELAGEMGRAAQRTVRESFSTEAFVAGMRKAIRESRAAEVIDNWRAANASGSLVCER
jgi:hypothetical protein